MQMYLRTTPSQYGHRGNLGPKGSVRLLPRLQYCDNVLPDAVPATNACFSREQMWCDSVIGSERSCVKASTISATARPRIFSARLLPIRPGVGHLDCDEKSNEIPTVQALPGQLGLEQALLTVDGMHCQKTFEEPVPC
jgi:hypothetical protein